MADIVSDLGVNLLEEEIDEVIFQTNQFLTDATFTGSQGPFWWILLAEFWECLEPSVNQLLAAVCSVSPKTDGTKTGQKRDLSIQRAACPDALFRLPLHPTPTKLQNCPVLTKNPDGNPLSSSPKNQRSPGSEYRERYSKSGTLILLAKKVEILSNFFLMANLLPVLPSFRSRIVQDGPTSSAVRFVTILLPGLYIQRVCHFFKLTGLSVPIASPDAAFSGVPLDIHVAVGEHSDLPCRPRRIVGKSGVFNRYKTL